MSQVRQSSQPRISQHTTSVSSNFSSTDHVRFLRDYIQYIALYSIIRSYIVTNTPCYRAKFIWARIILDITQQRQLKMLSFFICPFNNLFLQFLQQLRFAVQISLSVQISKKRSFSRYALISSLIAIGLLFFCCIFSFIFPRL